MPHRCEACGKLYSERKQLHHHEGNCSKLKELSDRQWNSMREVEKDPEERRKQCLAKDIFLGDNNTFNRFMKRLKKVGTSADG